MKNYIHKTEKNKKKSNFTRLKKNRVYFTHSKNHSYKKRGKTAKMAKTAKRGKMTKEEKMTKGGAPNNKEEYNKKILINDYENDLGIEKKNEINEINTIIQHSFQSNTIDLSNCYILGEGAFGKTYNNYEYALKIIKINSEDYFDELVAVKMIRKDKIKEDEIKELNIMNIRNWMIISDKLCFVMDKYEFSLNDLMDSFFKTKKVQTYESEVKQNGGTIFEMITDNTNKCDETKKLHPNLDENIVKYCFSSDKKINPENYLKLFNTIMKQVATGLKQIHANGFIHFDIKPDNIMINGLLDDAANFDEYLKKIHVYIIDFGLARYIGKQETITLNGSRGTEIYFPYEFFITTNNNNKILSRKVDIFAFGKTYLNIYTLIGYLLFNNKAKNIGEINSYFDLDEQSGRVSSLENNYFRSKIIEIHNEINTKFNNVFEKNTIVNTIAKCLDKDRRNRPTAEDLETQFTTKPTTKSTTITDRFKRFFTRSNAPGSNAPGSNATGSNATGSNTEEIKTTEINAQGSNATGIDTQVSNAT